MNTSNIENNFTYHPPKESQVAHYTRMRSLYKELALAIDESAPDSREKALAFTKLEESNMWFNAAIARNT